MPRKPMMICDATFATRLRKCMAEKGITQQMMGEQTERSRQAIAQYCNGASSPDWKTIANMARYLRVSSDYLLGLVDTPAPDADRDGIYRYGWEVGFDSCLSDLSAYLRERGTKA